MKRSHLAAMLAGSLGASAVDAAQPVSLGDLTAIRADLLRERAALDQQQRALDAQRARLLALENNLLDRIRGTGIGAGPEVAQDSTSVPLPPSPPSAAGSNGSPNVVQPVGQAPTEQRQVQVAALAEQGGVITRAGRLTIEPDLEYARADRNRAVFRGIEIPASVLIGVFDINESRQDVLTAAGVARFGVTNLLEVNARVPFVYRSDKSVLAPVADPANALPGQINRAVHGRNLGDIDFGVRYQFTNGTNGFPYLIGGVQVIAPSGTDPFGVRRDASGNALRGATGAGFWGVTPNVTAILPSDPAVLFGTFGYTRNFARNMDREIGATVIDRVAPGDQLSTSLGIAISLNLRTSLSLGYAHSWGFGTRTRLRTRDPQSGELSDPFSTKTRDLQLGRFLFGVSYRTSPRTTINWNVEIGATDDAADLRTTLRLPMTFDIFR